MTETELRPKRRTKATPEELEAEIAQKRADPAYVSPMKDLPMEEAEYPPVVENPEPVPETDLMEEAKAIFGDMVVAEEKPEKPAWKPRDDHFIDVKGGAKYLPARRRVQWMRQEPEPHPDWTIETQVRDFERGTMVSRTKIENGYAQVRATILNAEGRVISTGTAQEYSENFFDFLEKAETSAVARALALAGYGTESALDLDEGFIADSPFKRDGQMGGDITIESSSVEGIVQGGRSEVITKAQLDDIRKRARELDLDPADLVTLMNSVTGGELDISGIDPDDRIAFLLDHLKKLTFDHAAGLIQLLMAAD